MRNSTFSRGLFAMSTASVAALLVGLSLPAQAATGPDEAEPSRVQVEVPMKFTGYDAVRAAENGYDVRTTVEGYEYAVPATNPAGDMTAATDLYDPATERFVNQSIGESSARDTRTGDCGISFFFFLDQDTISTGYDITAPIGNIFARVWNVAVTSSIDAGSYSFSGPALGEGPVWSEVREIDTIALNNAYLSGVAGGEVSGTFGGCRALEPTDQILYLG